MNVCKSFLALLWSSLLCVSVPGQTNNSGRLSGEVSDTSGAAIRSASLVLTSEATLARRTVQTDTRGFYFAPLLPPGLYTLTVSSPGFAQVIYPHVPIEVDGSMTLNVHLAVGATETVNVDQVALGQPSNSGAVTDNQLVTQLPLAARNYTQILGLNTGVAGEVADAGSLGRGATSYTAGSGGFSSNGAPTHDNNFQMDGIDVNDIQGSGYLSRGVPVPSPDAIEEFRVSTQPFDASQGRNSGANINIVTRSGSAQPHGTLFEYFRNNDLNANTYYRKATGQPRPALKQNQFGGTLGGPILKPSLLGFGSYQETRQANGLDASCSDSVALPALTNDRSAAALGALFQGQRGYFQNAFGGVGPAIAADGSNINPVALAILQRRNADGSFLIPTPQTIVSANSPFDTRGLSTFSIVCPYVEHQGNVNVDWQLTARHRVAVHSFASNSSTQETLPASFLAGATLPSSPYQLTDRFRTLSIADNLLLRPNLVNEFRFGFNRLRITDTQQYPFTFSAVGATVPSFDDSSTTLTVADASTGGEGGGFAGALNTFVSQDELTYSRGRHFVHFGGGLTRTQDNQPHITFAGSELFLTFADFLLGQNAAQNGTAVLCAYAGCGAGYSDVAYSQDIPGRVQREYRILSGNAYVQDDIRFTPRLSVNAGLRYERLGDFADRLGHNTSFDPSLADYNPPAGGSFQGYVVPANYTGPVPAGVTRLRNQYGLNGIGQNTLQPRVGLAWQLPGGNALTLRAGYGLFRSRITADAYNRSVITPPFARLRQFQGTDPVSASLTLQQPLPPFTEALPSFDPYCPPASAACTEAPTFNGLAPSVQPPWFHRYTLDLETVLTPTVTFDLGYVGALSRHLLTEVEINQAGLASPAAPIHGITTNTLANLASRVPLPGWSVPNLMQLQSSGVSAYNSLQTSLRKRSTRSGEFLLSYTWARDLTDTFGDLTSTHGGTLLGDQNHPASTYGPDAFLRQNRFVATYLLRIPAPSSAALRPVLAGWQVTGVVVAQAGHALTPTYNNQFSVYGVPNDRPQLLASCAVRRSVAAEQRLGQWFNTACFTTPPVVGNDGVATGFGNAPIGIIRGPRQTNVDAALDRTFSIHDRLGLQLRAEAFNLFNHAQFADPVVELSSSSFGQVTSTSVNPRVLQLALRMAF